MKSLFLDALQCANRDRPPVWLMRQAGRYLPEYRKLREKWTLRELFFTPELAAQITMMPVELLGVDAAILFSDITVVSLALGLQLDFREGPQIEPPVRPNAPLSFLPVREVLQPIAQTIRLCKKRTVPLIGFCGAPFTVATYLVEDWKNWAPDAFEKLLDAICQVSIDYLQMQVEADVDAIQIFDSWANLLSKEEWNRYCFPYLKRMIQSIDVPVLLFMRGACHFVQELSTLQPHGISFDWQRPLSEMRKAVPKTIAVQGNLDPDLLFAPLAEIQQQTEKLIQSMEGEPGFILNLGHGVKPTTPVASVQCLIETVNRLSYRN